MWQIYGVTYTLLQPRSTMGHCWLTCASHLALAQVCVTVHIQTTSILLIYTSVLHNLDRYYFPYHSHPSISHTLLFSPPFSRSPQHLLKSQMALPFVCTCYPRGDLSLLMSQHWKQIVKHWTDSDPKCGLLLLLWDWPPKWIHGKNKNFLQWSTTST